MYYLDANKTDEEKAWQQLHKNAASNIEQTQSTNYTATYLPSRKLSKLDEPDMQDTDGEAGTAHKWCTPMDPHICPSKSRTASSNILKAALWRYGM